MSSHYSNEDMQACIRNCQACAAMCLNMAANHCLQLGGAHVEPAHFRTMLDCAEMCQTSANFMLRDSEFHKSTCRACAEICEACAVSCVAIGDMDDCVAACRTCATTCHAMANM